MTDLCIDTDYLVLESEDEVQEDSMGSNILREEFELALIRLKNNKAPGVESRTHKGKWSPYEGEAV